MDLMRTEVTMDALRSTSITPRIARMLRELQVPERGDAKDARITTPARTGRASPSRRDAYIPAVLAIGGAVCIVLAALQAWQLTGRGDAQSVATSTNRR
jgi:hypothetical protein